MIDTHSHLEQPDFNDDRNLVIQRCKKQLQAVITSCADPRYLNLTLKLTRQYLGFVFATASIHPSYVQKYSSEDIEIYIERIKASKESIIAIGETGLDYNWIKDCEWQERQRDLFRRLIKLSKELQLPLVIHSRDAIEDVLEILEQREAKKVQMHMFTSHNFLKRVLENNWTISINTLLLRSKSQRKIVRDCPLENLMLETDSPWLGLGEDGNIKAKDVVRNEPVAIKLVAKKICDIKGVDLEKVTEQTSSNAIQLFNLHFFQ
jgi:TatD DNase family protein